jgi:hypothetical protein
VVLEGDDVSRAYDVFLRILRRTTDVPAAPVGQVSLEVVDSGGDPELRMVDENGTVFPVGTTGGGTLELDDGTTDVTPVTKINVPPGTLTDDGGGEVTLTATGVVVSDDTPLEEDSTGDPGVSPDASRSDHVHPEHAGGSGATIQFPALKPGSPTDDFDGASLGGGYSAHSSGGSFATADCMTQGIDWMGSSVELQYSDQFGYLYLAHADTDLDFTWGGVQLHGEFTETAGPGSALMYGIAALDSSGGGVGVVAYTADQNAYLAAISGHGYSSFSDTLLHGGGGSRDGTHAQLWFRLKRVSGTWTGYISKSGRVWDKVFSTRADSVTVDRIAFGLWYDSSKVYSGRLTADYVQVDV